MAAKKTAAPRKVVIEVVRVGGGVNLMGRLRSSPGNKPIKVRGTNGLYELNTEPCSSIDDTVHRAKSLAKRHELEPIALYVPRLYFGVRS